MKRNINILLFVSVFASLLFFACEDLNDNLFPDKYLKILSLKETGIKDISMNTTQPSVVDSILILKGGGDPEAVSNLTLEVLSKEEAANLWGYQADQIEIIPSDSYELDFGQQIRLEAEESHKYIPVTFFPLKMYAAMKENTDAIWVLPVALTSATDTINNTKNTILMRFDVRSPLVVLSIEEEQTADILYQSLDIPLTAKISYSEENTLDFTGTLDVSENEDLVNAYNNARGTNYELLPAASYSFDDFSFSAGSQEAKSILQLSRSGLQSDHEYLLPLKLGTLSSDMIDKTDDIHYLIVKNPKYVYKEVDKADWKIKFVNTQIQWNAPQFYATSLIDGNLETAWGPLWDGNIPTWDDYDYGSVEYWGYHCFWERRDIPNIVIVVDLGRETTVGSIGIGQGTLDMGDRDLKSCEFYLGDSFTFTADGDLDNYNTVNKDNTWNLALHCKDIPHIGGGPYWYDIPKSDLAAGIPRGRYLKIRPTESYRENNLASFSEVYVKEIVAIDGVPVQ